MTSARPVSVGIRRGFLIGAALFATVGLVVVLVTRMYRQIVTQRAVRGSSVA